MRWAKVVGYRAAFDRDFIKVFVGEVWLKWQK
jgi:hypothetical protein